MRRIADLYPGEAKTDAKDAVVIADAARTMPHTLRTLDLADEITTELTMLVGFDQDLAGEANRTSNRIRGLLTQFHPSLERVLGPRLDHQAVTWLLERYGSPQALRKAGRRKLAEVVRPRAPRMAERLVDDIFTALDEQTVTVRAPAPSTSLSPHWQSRWPPFTSNAGPWKPGSRHFWRPSRTTAPTKSSPSTSWSTSTTRARPSTMSARPTASWRLAAGSSPVSPTPPSP